jgi:hypothetical protein
LVKGLPLIPLFNVILVTGIVNWLPKSKLIVMVMDIANSRLPAAAMWDVRGLHLSAA